MDGHEIKNGVCEERHDMTADGVLLLLQKGLLQRESEAFSKEKAS